VATARLANPKETIFFAVEFYGEPKSKKLFYANEGRYYDLAPQQEFELSGADLIHVARPKYDRAKLRLVKGDAINVAVGVFSGRRSSPDNLLDCGSSNDKLTLAAGKPVTFHCKLIGER
jgi:hypothetical protein